jgi:hypothetical protein
MFVSGARDALVVGRLAALKRRRHPADQPAELSRVPNLAPAEDFS